MRNLSIVLSVVFFSGGALASGHGSLLQKAKNSKLAHKAVAIVASVGLACGVMSCGGGDSTDEVVSVPTAVESAQEPAKIGLQYAVSQTSWMGAELATKQINASGGIGGMPLELLIRDSGGTPEQGIAVAEELVVQDGVDALVGPGLTATAMEVGTVAQRHGVPMLTTTVTDPAITRGGGYNYVFMSAFSDRFQSKAMARFASENLRARTAAILSVTNDAHSSDSAEIFARRFKSLSGQVVWRASYSADAMEFDSQLAEIARIEPDVVFVPDFTPDSPQMVEQGIERGINTIWLGGNSQNLPESVGETLDGTYFSTQFSPAGSQKFTANYLAEYGELPDISAALAYDAVSLIAQAMQRAASLDGAAVVAQLEETYNYRGATVLGGYDANHQADKGVVINTVRDGEIVFVRVVLGEIDHSEHTHSTRDR